MSMRSLVLLFVLLPRLVAAESWYETPRGRDALRGAFWAAYVAEQSPTVNGGSGPTRGPVIVPASAVNGAGTTIVPILLPDGLVGTPSLAFTTSPTTGLYAAAANQIGIAINGNQTARFFNAGGTAANTDLWLTGDAGRVDFGVSQDTSLARNAAAGVLKLSHSTATSTAEFQVSGGSGGFISTVKALTELTTIAAAATTTTAIQLPANAVILAVSVRVVTIIPTAATFTVTSATPAKTWNTVAVPVAAGTTDPGTAPGPSFQTTASVITITPNLTPGTATGQVRVTVYYYQVTPATS